MEKLIDRFPDNPIEKFHEWYTVAKEGLPPNPSAWRVAVQPFIKMCRRFIGSLYPPFLLHDPNAMTLATTTAEGLPAARVVLYKEILDEHFCFYTNYESDKGREIESNPYACLVFHWMFPERQVRICGKVEKLDYDISNKYWLTRPRGSRISALASNQSGVISGRKELVQRTLQIEKSYEGKEIVCPEHWGGYRVIPERIEFWQGRANRLHDRVLYTKVGKWVKHHLAP